MKNRTLVVLLLITIFGALARLYNLSSMPPSINWDEASLGYNAYSLLKTGKDEWGMVAPLIFRAFGDYKLPVYIYLDVLPTQLLDLNPFSTRLPSAIFGSITTFSIFYISYQLTKNRNISLLASLFIGLSPWTVWLSRIGLEGNVALSLFTLGLAVFIRNINTKSNYLGTLLLCLTLYTYNSYRLVTPLFFVILLLSLKKQINTKKIIINILFILILLTPVLIQFINGNGSARYKWVELINPGAISALEEKRNTSQLPIYIKKALYNRPSYLISNIAINYVSHFSPEFLFFKGGSNYQFNIVNFPIISPVFLPLLYISLIYLIKNIRNIEKYILGLLLISPLPASITVDAPHTLRASILIIPITLAIAIFLKSVNKKTRRYILITSSLVLIGTFFMFMSTWNNYKNNYYWVWQYGHSDLSKIIRSEYSNVDEIIITKRYGEPHIFILYDLKWNPTKFQNDSKLIRYGKSDWYWVDGFDKFKFVNDWELVNYTNNLDKDKKYLIISSPDNRIYGSSYIVSGPLGQPIYFTTNK